MYEKLSKETQLKIAEAHVTHFTKLIDAGLRGAPMVRLGECDRYLACWQAAVDRLKAGLELTEAQAGEFNDAVWSGDYERLYTEEERALLERAMLAGEDADAEAGDSPS